MNEIVTLDIETGKVINIEKEHPYVKYSYSTDKQITFVVSSNTQVDRDRLINELIEGNNFVRMLKINVKSNDSLVYKEHKFTILDTKENRALLEQISNRLQNTNLYITITDVVNTTHPLRMLSGLLDAGKADAEAAGEVLNTIFKYSNDAAFCIALIGGGI